MISLKTVSVGIMSAAFLSSVSSPAFSDGGCPAGFTNLGEAYQDASASLAEAKVQARPTLVKFPKNFILDTSYIQHNGRWSGGSAKDGLK